MRRLRSVVAALGLLVSCASAWLASACGDDAKDSGAPPPLSTAKPVKRDGGAEAAAPIDASAVDAGAQSRRYTGALSATAPASFGGSGYCMYRITMKQIEVDLTVTQAGEVAAAQVTSLAVEELASACPAGPIEANIHKYSLASSKKLPNGNLRIELARDPVNRPEASLVMEGSFGGDKADVLLEWHRTDQDPPLDWRIPAAVSVDLRK